MMLSNFQWVELEGDIIRGRKFWTRRLIERQIQDIEEILPMGGIRKSVVTAAVDSVLGSIRGYEIRFDEGPSFFLMRTDMTDVDGFIRTLERKLQS